MTCRGDMGALTQNGGGMNRGESCKNENKNQKKENKDNINTKALLDCHAENTNNNVLYIRQKTDRT